MRQRVVTACLLALALLTLTALALADLPVNWKIIALGCASIAYGLLIAWVRRSLQRHESLIDALADGLAGLHDKDYSVSIAQPEEPRWRRLVTAYNGLGAKLRSQHRDLYQRRLVL